ncbi:MAG TPA: class I SAM-dependent methyltransferase [Xanthomonadales bacterium]|nr:class I SAM-dependent methyltransferase [Xanthomonadales bacterium]
MSELVLRSADVVGGGAPFALRIEFEVAADVVFDVDVSLDLRRADGSLAHHAQLRAAGWDPSWLPRGRYACHVLSPSAPPAGGTLELGLWHHVANEAHCTARANVAVAGGGGDGAWPLSWQLESAAGTTPIAQLSWKRGAHDWFHKHFDHAARTVMSYMLGDSPLLRGRVLDVGCGDGITDLGIALRLAPQRFVGVDPFRGYERLPQILRDAHLPLAQLPDYIEFMPADANALPFEDDSFDVVLSWGSLEHIAGGHAQAFAEIRRVLRRDGLLFVHPGLYYSDLGHHLGEFDFAQREPYVHLKHPREELREMVLNGTPQRMDRAGDIATPAQYWQWFCELNPITVPGFEAELRALDFEPWRVALRTHDRVDYTAELQPYSFVDLASAELYVSAYNRKPAR